MERDSKRINRCEPKVRVLSIIVVLAIFLGMLAVLGWCRNTRADTEPNDDWPAVEAITPGTHTGSLGVNPPTDENDYYEVTVNAGQTIVADLTPAIDATGSMGVILYDHEKNGVGSESSNPGVTASVSWTTNSEQPSYPYYIRIWNNNGVWGTGNYSLKITLVDQDDAGSGGDVSDTIASPYPIAPGTHTGYLNGESGYDKRDYYSFDVDAGQRIFVNLTPSSDGKQTWICLYDESKDEIGIETPNPGVTGTVSWTTNSEQTPASYYVLVRGTGWEDPRANYTLNLTIIGQNDAGSGGDATDPPSSGGLPETPTAITPGTFTGYLNGETGDDLRDVYGTTVEAGKRLTVAVTPEATLSVNLFLMDEQHQTEYNWLDDDTYNNLGEVAEVSWAASISNFVYIWIKDQEGYGLYTMEVVVEDVSVPATVTLSTPAGGDTTSTSVHLTWTQNEDDDFDRYEIYASTTPGTLGTLYETETSQTTTSTTIYGLSPDTTYYFTVRVVNSADLHSDSNQVSAQTKESDGLPPITPPDIFGGFIALLLLVVLVPIIVIIVIVVVIVLVLKKKKGAPPPPPAAPPAAPPPPPKE